MVVIPALLSLAVVCLFLVACRRDPKAKLRKKLKAMSVHPVKNPYHDAPMGAVPSYGYFGVVWPELMHQTESGTMKTGVKSTVKLMVRHGAATGRNCQIM